jgi:hypothetical protein
MEMIKQAEAMGVERYVPGHGFVEEPALSVKSWSPIAGRWRRWSRK